MVLGAIVVTIVGILVVNYFKDRNVAKTLEEAAADSKEEQLIGSIHEVTKGESLWVIAENAYGSGYNWTDIANANNLTDYTLEIGQKLTIPDVFAKQPTSTKVSQETTIQTENAITGDSYTVTHGDNLWDISVRAYGDGFKWIEIAKANNLSHPDLIHSGNNLAIPR